MARFLLILASIASVVSAQCGVSDHPNCVSWAKNGFCTNPGYTKAMIKQNCPKACPNVGCTPTCLNGSTLVSLAINNACPVGTLVGSVCCQTAGPACPVGKTVIGPSVGGLCPAAAVAVGVNCCN